MEFNQIVEKCTVLIRDINRYGCIVAIHKAQEYIDAEIYTLELVEFLKENPYGNTDKYQWETRKVDELVNVTIWKVK